MTIDGLKMVAMLMIRRQVLQTQATVRKFTSMNYKHMMVMMMMMMVMMKMMMMMMWMMMMMMMKMSYPRKDRLAAVHIFNSSLPDQRHIRFYISFFIKFCMNKTFLTSSSLGVIIIFIVIIMLIVIAIMIIIMMT